MSSGKGLPGTLSSHMLARRLRRCLNQSATINWSRPQGHRTNMRLRVDYIATELTRRELGKLLARFEETHHCPKHFDEDNDINSHTLAAHEAKSLAAAEALVEFADLHLPHLLR